MKRTFSANINGRIFNIDEDAFNLLNSYLEQLRLVFRGNEGGEIVSDIEARIGELFTERVEGGVHVITIDDVSTIIETMGSPEALGTAESESGAVPPPLPDDAESRSFISFNLPRQKKLFRNLNNKVFGGVFGGLSVYLGWNANVMRILYIILSLCTYFWPLTLLYLLAWMIIPVPRTPLQQLEMYGEPVNVDTLGQAVIATETPAPSDGGFISGIFTVLGKVLMGFLGLGCGAVSFACLIAFLILCAGAVAYGIAGSTTILAGLEMYPLAHLWATIVGGLAGFGVGILLFGLIAWNALSVVFNFKGAGKTTVITLLIITMILFALAAVMFAIGLA